MYTLNAFEHPVLARVRLLGACALKEEIPTGTLYVFVDASTTRLKTEAIRRAVLEACPGRRIYTCVRARLARGGAGPIASVRSSRTDDARSA